MKQKPITPYARLLDEYKQFASNVKHRGTTEMCAFPEDRLHKGWRLDGVYHQVLAASQLGYEVLVEADAKGLTLKYRKKINPTYRWL